MENKNCNGCEFLFAIGEIAECRKYPPTVIDNDLSCFPNASYRCGEYRKQVDLGNARLKAKLNLVMGDIVAINGDYAEKSEFTVEFFATHHTAITLNKKLKAGEVGTFLCLG